MEPQTGGKKRHQKTAQYVTKWWSCEGKFHLYVQPVLWQQVTWDLGNRLRSCKNKIIDLDVRFRACEAAVNASLLEEAELEHIILLLLTDDCFRAYYKQPICEKAV